MNYIYDIFLNFNKEAYDFYDWNVDDNIIHVRKIPVFKVKSSVIEDVKKNVVSFNKNVLEKIYNKTEVFNNSSLKKIDYSMIITDSLESYALKLNDLGGVDLVSKFLLDEESEILEFADEIEETDINYIVVSKKDSNRSFKTRLETEIEVRVRKKIDNLQKALDESVLKYLYYECFNEKEEDINIIVNRINNSILESDYKVVSKIDEFFKLLSSKNKTNV